MRTPISRAPLLLLLVALAPPACRDATGPAARAGPLPLALRFVAEAHAVDDDGISVDCTIVMLIELDAHPARDGDVVAYHGRMGGEASRYVLDRTGAGVGFWADIGGPVAVRLIGSDSLEVGTPGSAETPERFWREFARFAGTRRDATDAALGSGHWTCRPMDIPEGGYADTSHEARGSWTLEPGPNVTALAPAVASRILLSEASPFEGTRNPAMIRTTQLTSTIRRDAPVARMLLGAVRPGARIFGGRAARGRAP